jgi:hypothetical protein
MSTVIYDMLKEEKQRNLEMQEVYKREIEMLPKGSISEREISGRTYYYLKYRQGAKVKNDYIGKDKNAAEKIKRETEKRKYLQAVLKRLEVEYRQISVVVKD